MQRYSSVALGGLVLLALVVLLWKGGPRSSPAPEHTTWLAAVSSSARLPVIALSALTLPAVAPPEPLPEPPPPLRALPPSAPKSVRIGVVLYQYRGAQFAPSTARDKLQALEAARSALPLARRDFKAAVKQGDAGSTEDAGRILRNILEPPIEYEVFTLAPGAVSEPIDTPRGYWIARRVE